MKRIIYIILVVSLSIALFNAFCLAKSHSAICNPKSEIYEWKNVEIVGGGFIPGIIFSPIKPNLIYCRTDIGGAYRWNPETKRWIPLTDWIGPDDWNLLGIESIAADPVDPNLVYLAAGTYTNDWVKINAAILRSTNQGHTWQRINLPFKLGGNEPGRSIGERLAIDPNSHNILYLGTRKNGLWKSVDSGSTWNKVDSFPVENQVGFVIYDKESSQSGVPCSVIYIGVAPSYNKPESIVGLYQSMDAGKTWVTVPGQPNQKYIPHHAVLCSDKILYLTYCNGLGPNEVTAGAVWKYDTKTNTWTDITPENPGNFGYAGLAIDPNHPETVMVSTLDRWAQGDTLFRSTDAGKTWLDIKSKTVRDSSISPYLNWGRKSAELGHWIGDLEIDPFDSNQALYVTGATMWGTNNMTDIDSNKTTYWSVRADGIEETGAIDIISPPKGAHLISGLGDICGFRHNELTQSPPEQMMQNPMFNSTNTLDFAEKKSEVIVRVGWSWNQQHGAISIDGGTSWKPFATEPTKNQAGVIAISSDAKTIIWTPENSGSYLSFDSGSTWTECNGISRGVVVVADRVNPKKFYAFNSGSGTMYMSKDRGKSFKATVTGLPEGYSQFRHLRAVPGYEGDLWLATGSTGFYRSTDSGKTMKRVRTAEECEAVGFGKAAPGKKYPALYIVGKVRGIKGIFRSDDIAKTWVRINDDNHQWGWIGRDIIGDPRIYGRVYLGTNGRGIFYGDPVVKAKSKVQSSKSK
ncbi:MAG: carbohydrate-binding protein [bacterium]